MFYDFKEKKKTNIYTGDGSYYQLILKCHLINKVNIIIREPFRQWGCNSTNCHLYLKATMVRDFEERVRQANMILGKANVLSFNDMSDMLNRNSIIRFILWAVHSYFCKWNKSWNDDSIHATFNTIGGSCY